jgi:hypothetical protein
MRLLPRSGASSNGGKTLFRLRNSADVLRHIIKNVSSRLVGMVRLETLFRALLDVPDRGMSYDSFSHTSLSSES